MGGRGRWGVYCHTLTLTPPSLALSPPPLSLPSSLISPSSLRPSEDASRYWSQFAQQREEPADRRQRRNGRLVWYCVLIMSGSMIMHYMGFRTLREINNTFIDEQQQRILKLYNEVKERARVNGVRKQQEILRQKHAEYTEKYGGRGRADGAER
ncbi:hypothetical protein FKM82_025521 [Ascaphus truei]